MHRWTGFVSEERYPPIDDCWREDTTALEASVLGPSKGSLSTALPSIDPHSTVDRCFTDQSRKTVSAIQTIQYLFGLCMHKKKNLRDWLGLFRVQLGGSGDQWGLPENGRTALNLGVPHMAGCTVSLSCSSQFLQHTVQLDPRSSGPPRRFKTRSQQKT